MTNTDHPNNILSGSEHIDKVAKSSGTAGENRRVTLAIIVLTTLIPCARLLNLTNSVQEDWDSHLFTINYFGEFIRQHFALPTTLNTSVIVGAPNPAFYGILFYPITGFLAAIIGANLAIRFVIVFTFFLQTWQVYATGNVLSQNRYLGYTIAVATDASIYALTNLYNRGDITEFVSTGLLVASIAAWTRAHFALPNRLAQLQAALFLALATATHPVIILLGLPSFAIITMILSLQKRPASLAGIGVVACVQVLVLAPWLYAYLSYQPFIPIGSLFSSGPTYYDGVDSIFSRFDPIPYDGDPTGTRNLDAQINLPLALLVVIFSITVYRLRRRFIPAILSTTIAMLIAIYSAFPQLGAVVHVLGTIQFSYRLVSYVNLFLLFAVFLLASETRVVDRKRSLLIFTTAVAVCAIIVVYKETRANIYHGTMIGSSLIDDRSVLTTMFPTGSDYAVPIRPIDAEPKRSTEVAIGVGVGSSFGYPTGLLIGPDAKSPVDLEFRQDLQITRWAILGLSPKKGDLHFEKRVGPDGSDALVTSVTSEAFARSPRIPVSAHVVYTLSVYLDSTGNTKNGNVAFYILDADSGRICQGYATTRGTKARITFPAWSVPDGVKSVRLVYALNSTGITGNVIFAQPDFHAVTAPRGSVVITNVQSFPWNHLTVNGNILSPAQELNIARPKVNLALGFRSSGNSQIISAVTMPDFAWSVLRIISFWSALCVAAAVIIMAWRGRKSSSL